MACLIKPELHNIKPENVLFIYRQNDIDSLEIAQYYASAHCLSASNLLAVPCSDNNLIMEDEMISTIEEPALSYLLESDPYSSSGQKEIWVIILGYHVPTVYLSSDPYSVYGDPYGEYLSIASRLHRVGKSTYRQYPNFTYDRKDFRFFNALDAEDMFITAVINGPTKESAKKLIDRSIDVSNQQMIVGKIYVDPYGKKSTQSQLDYQESILDFIDKELSNLGLPSYITTDTDSNSTEPTIPKLYNDAFYWGWFNPLFSKDLFLNQNERRVFLYNADDDGAYDITQTFDENGSDPWTILAINAGKGYAATAGATSSPGETGYLQARPFFETLHQGASLGEAFLFSTKYVDWKVFLIGDPLLTCIFPSNLPVDQDLNNQQISNYETITQIKTYIETGLAYGERQDLYLQRAIDLAIYSSNIQELMSLLYGINEWTRLRNLTNVTNSIYTRALLSLTTFILETTGLSFSEWLSENNQKTSILVSNVLAGTASGPLDSELIYDSNYWYYEFVYDHTPLTYESVFFQLQISVDSDFLNLVVDVNSQSDNSNWYYEKEKSTYSDMPSDGFPSNYGSRRTKYAANTDQYLTRTNLYYVRWKAINTISENLTEWQVETNQIIIRY